MSVITVALSIVTGICIWAGVDQLLIGLRRMRERAHLIFAVFCFLAAGYVLTAIIGYQAASVDAFASVLKRKVALLALTGVTFLWFVAIHTRVQPFGLLLILSSVFAASSALNLLAPYGLLYDEISALTDVELAWGGTIVLPEATSNVWRLILFVGFAALVGFTCYACFQQYRAGKRTSALTLGVGVAVLVAAILHDIYVNAMGITSVRLMEFGFAALVIVISLNLSNQIIAIANIKRELYESVSRYRSLYNNTPLMLHSTDREGHLLTVNNHWLETLGYERDQVIGCCYTEFLAEGCRQYFEEVALSALWRTGSVKDVALQMVNKGGEVIDVEMSAIAERDVRGDLTRSIAFLIDIAERKRVENELHEHCEQLEELVEKRTLALARADEQLQQESADRLRVEASLWEMQATLDGILESAMDAIVTVDGDYQIVLFNPAAERMFGYTMAEVKGRPLNHLMPSEFHETHTDDIREFGRTGATARRMGNGKVTWGIRADGERFPVEASISRIDVAGKRYFTAIVRDITERAHVETELRKLARAVELSPSAVLIADPDGNIEYVNPQFTKLTGYVPDEVLGQNPRILKSGKHSPEFYANLWNTIKAGEEWQGEFSNLTKDGEPYRELASISPMTDTDGQIVNFVKVAADITALIRVEDALRQRVNELATLNHITQAVTATIDLPVSLGVVVEAVAQLFDASAAIVYFLDGEQSKVLAQFEREPVSDEMGGSVFESGEVLASIEPALETGQPLTFSTHELSIPPAIREWMRGRGVHAVMIVPLRVRGTVIGFMEVATDRAGRVFTANDVNVAETIAGGVAAAIESDRLDQQVQAAVVAAERQRFTRELPDSVARSLDVLTRHADEWGTAAVQGSLDTGQSAECFDRLGGVSQQVLKELRLLIYQLPPPILEDVGLAGALQQRLDTVEQRVSIATRLIVEGEVDRIDYSVQEQLFHIALEALNNALRHADATTVTVRIYAQGDLVGLFVEDNGIGFDAGQDLSGMGLDRMRERAEAIGAQLLVTSVPGLGTVVEATLAREPVGDI